MSRSEPRLFQSYGSSNGTAKAEDDYALINDMCIWWAMPFTTSIPVFVIPELLVSEGEGLP